MHSQYDPAGFDPGCFDKDVPAATIQERDQPWYEPLTEERHRRYRAIAMTAASYYLRNKAEVEMIADAVLEELWVKPDPPTTAQIEGYIWTVARSRAIDHIRSLRYKNWKRWTSYFQKDENGEEQIRADQQLLVDGPEEEFFLRLEEEEYSETDQRRLALLDQAISRIKDNDLRACFVMRFIEQMQPSTIAKELELPVSVVYDHIEGAKRQVTNFMRKQDAKCEKAKRKGRNEIL